MSVLRKRVAEHQRKSKAYADQRRAARVPKFQVGTYVRVKKPIPGPKGTPSYGPPLKILKRIGRWSFCWKTVEPGTLRSCQRYQKRHRQSKELT
ncbi:hypothetical protein HPB49_026184 [Dermacentor silvarum]|nr:hypothetical protein HPB49_026184 [Dermacentor silvarum]